MLMERPIERTLAVVGLAGVALIHLLDLHDTFLAAPYKGWLYVALIVGSLACAAALVRLTFATPNRRAVPGAVRAR